MLVQIPTWPFVSLSFAFGVFPLIPFWALRTPAKDLVVPPPREEMVSNAHTPLPLPLLFYLLMYKSLCRPVINVTRSQEQGHVLGPAEAADVPATCADMLTLNVRAVDKDLLSCML